MAVIWMYSKGGGKYGAHSLVLQTPSIGQLSFMALQVYEQTFCGQFRAFPNITRCVFAFQYVHPPAVGFLCRVAQKPRHLDGETGPMEICSESLNRFQTLSKNSESIGMAMRSLNQPRRRGGGQVATETGVDED